MTRPRPACVLSIYPTSRDFGWIALEGPLTPLDWGLVRLQGDKNLNCLQKVEKLMGHFLPETVVFEVFEHRTTRRTDRLHRLCLALRAVAADRGHDVALYTREDIRACFASVGARTRHEIAQAVVRHIDALRHQLPKNRRVGDDQDRRMALFSAAAAALTHYQLGMNSLFDELRDSA